MDLEDGADDAADGLHLVPHLDLRALGLPGRLGLALLGPDEEEVPEDPDRHAAGSRVSRELELDFEAAASTKWASAGVGVMRDPWTGIGCDAPP